MKETVYSKDMIQCGELLVRAERLIDAAKKAGANAADAVVVRRQSKSVSVRLSKVENTQLSESDDFNLRVFVGQKSAMIGAGQGIDDQILAERAVAMAKVSPEDPYIGLADKDDLVRDIIDLDLYDEKNIPTDEMTKTALLMEETALSVRGVKNSLGAEVSSGMGGLVLATSAGFSGSYMITSHTRSVSVLAGEGTNMERDYDYDHRLFYKDLIKAENIGLSAAKRAVRRLHPRKVPTASSITVVFDPRVSRGIFEYLVSAINGASIARKTSFLRDQMDCQIMSKDITIIDDPKIPRRPGSRPFDGEGVDGEKMMMVDNGVLKNWYLSTSIARQLGLKTNGRGSRSGAGVGASSSNVLVSPGKMTPEALISSVNNGLYITEVIGAGVNIVTGEYSQGASGFWIENGVLTYPVSEITIASNLKDMFKRIVLANDIDPKYLIVAPTIAIEGMTLAGD